MMCLVCGLIGCFESRPVSTTEADDEDGGDGMIGLVPFIAMEQAGHSVKHYEETRHVYAQDIESQQVWDFNKVSVCSF